LEEEDEEEQQESVVGVEKEFDEIDDGVSNN
jgi:hypothetical protein